MKLKVLHVRPSVTSDKTWCGLSLSTKARTWDDPAADPGERKWRYCRNCTLQQQRKLSADRTVIGDPTQFAQSAHGDVSE